MKMAQKILRVREGGLLHGGPPCSSFVWVNAGTSGRSSANPEGNRLQRTVKTANETLGHLKIYVERYTCFSLSASVIISFFGCRWSNKTTFYGGPYQQSRWPFLSQSSVTESYQPRSAKDPGKILPHSGVGTIKVRICVHRTATKLGHAKDEILHGV